MIQVAFVPGSELMEKRTHGSSQNLYLHICQSRLRGF